MKNNDNFELSGLSKLIEDYKCFEDLARDEWVDGSELKNNLDNWTDKQREKWRFFYRPVRALVGLEQKLKIDELKKQKLELRRLLDQEIKTIKGDLAVDATPRVIDLSVLRSQPDAEIADLKESFSFSASETTEAESRPTIKSLTKEYEHEFVKMKRGLLIRIVILLILLSTSFFIFWIAVFLIASVGLLDLIYFLNNKYDFLSALTNRNALFYKEIEDLWDVYSEELEVADGLIQMYESEIDTLMDQITTRPIPSTIENWLEQELEELKAQSLATFLNEGPEEEPQMSNSRFVKLDTGIPNPAFSASRDGGRTNTGFVPSRSQRSNPPALTLKGWALLQPVNTFPSMGGELDGLFTIKEGDRMGFAAWRMGSQNQPIFRVWYITYLFLLDNKIGISSFFYDFIAQRQYGKSEQIFRTGHIADHEIIPAQVVPGEWVEKLKLSQLFEVSFFTKEIKTFSLSASSGDKCRRVLIDDEVIEGVNQWLAFEEQIRTIIREKGTNDPEILKQIETIQSMYPKLADKWGKSENNGWTDEIERGVLAHFPEDRIPYEKQGEEPFNKIKQQLAAYLETDARNYE